MMEISTIIIALQIGVLVSLLAAFSAWNRTYLFGNKSFSWFMMLLAWWAFAYSIELTVFGESTKLFWAKLQYLAIPFVATTMVTFVVHASAFQNERIKRHLPLTYVIPVLTLIFVYLKQEWIWSSTSIIEVGSSQQLDYEYGSWFYAYYGYSLLMFAIGFVLIFRMAFSSPRLTKIQSGLFLLGALIPMALNIAYVLNLEILPAIDLTPLALVTFGFITALAIFEFRLTDLLPVVYDTAFESLPDPMLVLDSSNRVLTGNPAAQKQFRLNEQRLNNQSVEALLPPHWANVITASSSTAPAIFEVMDDDENASSRIYELRLVPLMDRRKRHKGRMLFMREITARKRALQALAQREQELAERVEERTAELQATNVKLLRTVQMKDEFLANMSHELRTPLSAVIGTVEAMQAGVYGTTIERQIDPLNRIDSSANHLLSLINDILDVSKIEAGKFVLRIGEIDIDALSTSCLNLIMPDAQKKSIRLSFVAELTRKELILDERRVRQILLNLLSNAIKFTPAGGKVGLQLTENAARHVTELTVWDTGIGISQEDQKRIFEPFVQLDSALSREYEGTGLGLALTGRLAEMLGGKVRVISQTGSGSRFTVTLPWDCRSVTSTPYEEIAASENVLASKIDASS